MADRLRQDSLDWALTHIRRFGDTDLFPMPFEYDAIAHCWELVRSHLLKQDLATYESRARLREVFANVVYGG